MYKTDTKIFEVVENPNLSADKTPMEMQDLTVRVTNFDEVAQGYTAEQAMEEAARCLGCPGHYCQNSCPAHVPVPEFIAAVRAGEFEAAYQLISQANNLPAITGRVCAQEKQCESNCTRGIKCQPTGIGRLERFVADWHYANTASVQRPVSNGKRVIVAGSGPAGLSCAADLAKAGYAVTVKEADSFLGGVPAYGIPTFVLPRKAIDAKIQELKEMGVTFEVNAPVTDPASLVGTACDAVFLATGAGKGVQANLPGEALPGVYSANAYLKAANQDGAPIQGKTVAVIGGGNTAIDASRTALRAGAARVCLVYRRGREEMPARTEEVENAVAEGVELVLFANPVAFEGTDQVTGIRCVKTELTAPDYPMGRKNVVNLPDSEFVLEADTVVLALGYAADPIPGIETGAKGKIVVDQNLKTSAPGVYAGGDSVNGAATLVAAMAAGKQGAAAIQAALQ